MYASHHLLRVDGIYSRHVSTVSNAIVYFRYFNLVIAHLSYLTVFLRSYELDYRFKHEYSISNIDPDVGASLIDVEFFYVGVTFIAIRVITFL